METPWLNSKNSDEYSSLQKDLTVEVCVIGGGITGITTAFLLQEAGKNVVLLERRKIGEGDSGHTSGHLTSLVDMHYYNMISDFSEEHARKLYKATSESRDLVERLIADYNLQAGFERVPFYYYATSDVQLERLQKEQDALKAIGVETRPIPFPDLPFKVHDCFKVEGQAVINTGTYISNLAKAFVEKGGQIYEQTPVTDFRPHNDYVEIRAGEQNIKADFMVQATHTPLKINPLQMEMKNYNSYVVMGEPWEIVKKGLFVDFDKPYHYTRHYDEGEANYYITGGFDTKSGTLLNEQEQIDKLRTYAIESFKLKNVVRYWSAMYFETPDGLPFIGKDPIHDSCFLATGFGGDGLTYGLLSAIINCDLITKGSHGYEKMFSPKRFKLAALGDLTKKLAATFRHLVLDRFQLDGTEVAEIPSGQGTILDIDGERIGLYVDENRKVFPINPVCTHMKCILHWNAVGKTWDCECHGSRFDIYGEVVAGPATANLRHTPEKKKS